MRGFKTATAVVATLMVACEARTPNDEVGVSAALAEKLTSFSVALEELRNMTHIPGLSVAVLKDQEVILKRGFGYADLQRQVPATAETPYDIGSVSKPLSAVVALRLVELGVLDLDRPMADYSEWARFCREFSQQPTIFSKDLRCDPAIHTLRHLLSHTATGRPGERFSYNPTLFSWASRPMMAVAGVPFSSMVEAYVFNPAGMRSARRHRALALPAGLAASLAPPHRTDASGALIQAPPLPPQGDGAAGGVIASVDDLAKFDVALDRGELIAGAMREAMMTPTRSTSGERLPYGLGWYVQEHENHTLVWHSGWWEQAYSALYLKVPDSGWTLILLANSEGVWWGNPLDEAQVDKSPFAAAFIRYFL